MSQISNHIQIDFLNMTMSHCQSWINDM